MASSGRRNICGAWNKKPCILGIRRRFERARATSDLLAALFSDSLELHNNAIARVSCMATQSIGRTTSFSAICRGYNASEYSTFGTRGNANHNSAIRNAAKSGVVKPASTSRRANIPRVNPVTTDGDASHRQSSFKRTIKK